MLWKKCKLKYNLFSAIIFKNQSSMFLIMPLENKFVVGTGTMPPLEKLRAGSGPRVFPVKVRQGDKPAANRKALCLIGKRDERIYALLMSDAGMMGDSGPVNYSVVSIPRELLPGVKENGSRAIHYASRNRFTVFGYLPSEELKQRLAQNGYIRGKQEAVFVSPEDLPGLRLG
jgi:hypothetical protein